MEKNSGVGHLSSLTVREWLLYIPIFVDFSQIGPFTSWMEKEIKDEVFIKTLEEIRKFQTVAWISPDLSTHVAHLRGKINGLEVDIGIQFRLRTLCLEIRCWKTLESELGVLEAFENMKNAEEEFKNFIKKWEAMPICNFLVVKPFYNAEVKAEKWMRKYLEDLQFFPTNCDIGSAFTLSISKLLEKDEKLPFIVTGIRDNTGVQRKIIVIGSEKVRASAGPEEPCSYYRVRWVFFTSLIQHVLKRINERVLSIGEAMSKIERDVLKKPSEPSEDYDSQRLIGMLSSIIDFSRQLSSLENELALISDDLVGVERNLKFFGITIRPKKASKDLRKDKKICGNVDFVSLRKPGVGFGIFLGPEEEEARSHEVRCISNYYCIHCDSRSGGPDLAKEPPLDMDVLEETEKLIDYSITQFRLRKTEIVRCMDRTKSFVSRLSSILSTQVNVSLDQTLSKAALDQKEILSKVETLLEEAEKDRKVTQRATKAVETLSLLFASFVLGEISSNFIIWWLQQIWPTQVPWFAYSGGFFLALGIAGMIFLVIYLGYLRKKWMKRL